MPSQHMRLEPSRSNGCTFFEQDAVGTLSIYPNVIYVAYPLVGCVFFCWCVRPR